MENMRDNQELWKNIAPIIKEKLGMTIIAYETWIAPLYIVSCEGGIMNLHSPFSDTENQYVEKRYMPMIQYVVSEYMGESYEVLIE
ncbi:hypothetical protein SAMN04487770_13652 [Butyrivibrio sp. ob235]|uniref:hypothetical protein n=1 Tax=Butyrivibrio sp. ob235 TaxID=1761780 RepID=UPI0008C689F4|nr:hypothetical protein [Butyrivibrio sp. ob235]SEM39492.1 hypothetical protein SAMN04487770_13652 [Butyrivibrio sp. ob235]